MPKPLNQESIDGWLRTHAGWKRDGKQIAKEFRFFNRAGVTLSADLFNALNDRTVLQRTLRTGPARATSNRITELQSPRVWRFGAKISF